MQTSDLQMAEFAKECRDKGLSVTAQRLAVYRDISATDTHPTAEEVHDRVRRHFPTLSLATVYKTLETFEKMDFVHKTRATGEKARYDGNRVPHHHMICKTCGRIQDVYEPALGNLALSGTSRGDFKIEDYRIDFYGVCGPCRKH